MFIFKEYSDVYTQRIFINLCLYSKNIQMFISTKYSNEYAYNKEYLDGYCITKKTLSLSGIYPQNSQIIKLILKEHSDVLFICSHVVVHQAIIHIVQSGSYAYTYPWPFANRKFLQIKMVCQDHTDIFYKSFWYILRA